MKQLPGYCLLLALILSLSAGCTGRDKKSQEPTAFEPLPKQGPVMGGPGKTSSGGGVSATP
jgi:hypothetical protein